jgi:PPM family protein phosphatase
MSRSKFEIGKATRLGNRRVNQDRSLAVHSLEFALLAVADGMGGHPKGEVAAQILIDTAEALFYRSRKPVADPALFLTHIFHQAHDEITTFGLEQTPPIDPRTTAVVVLVQSDQAYWAHVGDSRLYLYRQGKVCARTQDHSYVERLRRDGVITEDERDTHPQRHYVTRCLGGGLQDPGVTLGKPQRLEPGDTLFLCTDGLWAHIEEEDIGAALASDTPLERVVDDLVREAELHAFPESDNVTASALRWQREAATGRAALVVQAKGDEEETRPQDKLSLAIEELTQAIGAFEAKTRKE